MIQRVFIMIFVFASFIIIIFAGCSTATTHSINAELDDLNLSQNVNDVVDVNFEAGLLLNYGDKRSPTPLDDGIKLENTAAATKSKVDLLSDVFRKNIEKLKTKHKKLDVVFLIDGSSSVGKKNFKSELKFVKKLLSDFPVSYEYTRVAVVTFSSQNRIIRHVDQITDPSKASNKCNLLNYELAAIKFPGGGTYTYGALTEAKDILHYARSGSKKIIFLISDGFSNGQNPIPQADEIKKSNTTIFTISIQNGNSEELFSIATSPGKLHSYLLASFEQFEGLARKALHSDYKVGETVTVQNRSLCNVLCDQKEDEFCCDKNAHCGCETSSGHYRCICEPGFHGTGLNGSCQACSASTYWDSWNNCKACPDKNHVTTKELPLSVNDCVCKDGFKADENNKCEAITCPELKPPENGYFIKSQTECAQVLNAACGARCKSGYQLTGSSIRVCQENGWSGTATECVLKACPALQVPYYGTTSCKNPDLNLLFDYSPKNLTFMANYSKDIEKFTEPMPIDTECNFKCGHGYYLVGSRNRNCLPISKWDGLTTSCKQITCQPLPKVQFGEYEPADCTEDKSEHGYNCTLTCEFGFELKGGPATKTCMGKRNGYWTHKNKNPRCVDVTPPTIECPGDYSLPLHQDTNYTIVKHLLLPYVSDNSGVNVTFWSKPAIKEKGLKLGIGDHLFTYVVVDGFKNKEKCTFTLTIVDINPPVFENCEDPPTVYIGAKKNTANHTFVEWDEPSVFDNSLDTVNVERSLNFSYLDTGVYEVRYTASDKSENFAECRINVTVEERKCEMIPSPGNGQSICARNSTHTWCEVACDFGYGIVRNEELLDTFQMTCENREAVWNETAPECSLIEQPEAVEEIFTITLDSEPFLCNDSDAQNEISGSFISTIKEHMCHDQEDCEVSSDLPECLATPENTANLSHTYYNIAKREVQSVSKSRKMKMNVYVRMGKKLGIWQNDSSRIDNIKRVKSEIRNIPNNPELKQKIIDYKFDVVGLKLDELVRCNEGSVSRKLNCVQCPQGTFHNTTLNACENCPVGTFNNHFGRTHCLSCPPNYVTRKTGSKDPFDCKQLCPPGTFAKQKFKLVMGTSSRSVMPYCKKCSPGEFNEHFNQISCMTCPPGHISPRGSTSAVNCTQQVKPCSIVPSVCAHQGRCVAEPNSMYSYSCQCVDGWMGAHCEIPSIDCNSFPCSNGGSCSVTADGKVACTCMSPFHGEFCEVYGDPCLKKDCMNGGSCVEIGGRAICECLSGFEGDKCEVFKDLCDNSPCIKGVCRSVGSEGYQCQCPAGYIGKRCHLKPCDYLPCHGQSICVDVVEHLTSKNSFRCECPKGYRGTNCTEIDNPCDSNPCRNNGVCEPVALRTQRQTIITSIYLNEETYTEYKCTCAPFFYGDNCETLVTPDFIMDFQKTSVNNYIRLNGPNLNLKEISFCVWIQTNDSFNYGTLLSYAAGTVDNMFTLTDYNGFVLYVNGSSAITDIILNDGNWHFVCVTWRSDKGYYEIFVDGRLIVSGMGLNAEQEIEGNGVLIIGQEQDTLGGSFSESETFVGRIAYLDIWKRALNGYEVLDFYSTCEPYQGDIFAWTDFKLHAHGDIKIYHSQFCRACPKDLSILNGEVMYQGSQAVFSCHTGYNLVGSNVRRCLRTSKWESSYPTCKLIRCGFIGTVTNGKVNLDKSSYGGVATFECDEGYELNGNAHRNCGLDGSWTGLNPECISNAKLIYATEKGQLNSTDESFYTGTLAEVQCDVGYTSDGENLMTCLKDGNWDIPLPHCVPEAEPPNPFPVLQKSRPDKQFWQNLNGYIFFGCNPVQVVKRSILCERYKPNPNLSDLSVLESLENLNLTNVDHKLLDLFEHTLASINFHTIDLNNFFDYVLYQNETDADEKFDESVENSLRLTICFYMNMFDQDLDGISSQEGSLDFSQKVQQSLALVVQPIYEKYLEDMREMTTTRKSPLNAIQAIIASKEQERQKNRI